MRLLIVHPHMDVVGGSEVLTSLLVERVKGFVEVGLLTSSVHELHEPRVRGAEVLSLERPSSPSRGEALRLAVEGVWRALERFEPTHLLIMIQEPVYVAAAKLFNPRLPAAIYIHFPLEEEADEARRSSFYSMLRFPNEHVGLFGLADVRMSNSAYTASALKRLTGLDSSVVYPAVPGEYFEGPEPRPGDKEPLVVSVGRLVPQKGFHRLVEAFSRVRARGVRARLVIVGVEDPRYSEYRRRLEELASRAGDVELIVRPMKPSEIAEIHRRALVYVHLRVGEHFGMSPVEAMSQAAVPVIPRRSGLAELVVDGFNGFLLEEASIDEVAAVLERLLGRGVEGLWPVAVRARRTSLFFHPDRFALQVLSHAGLAGAGVGVQGLNSGPVAEV